MSIPINPQTPPPASERLACLDAYRGFVIAVMIWVNYIGEMPAIPAWLKHASASADTVTFPDLVFPGFLFMVGVSIALALGKQRQHSVALPALLARIGWRAGGLIVAGVMLVNAERYDSAAALLSPALYYALFYVAAMLLWQHGAHQRERLVLGAALMMLLAALFRGTTDDVIHSSALAHSWWGILGMIGWTYCAVSLIYLACGGNSTALMGIFGLLLAAYMGERAGTLAALPDWINQLFHVGELFGSTAANVLAGTLVGNLFLRDDAASDSAAARIALHWRRLRFMALFALGALAAGALLRPYHGINKIHATEAYTLVCVGINLLAFMLFYLAIEVLHWRRWSTLLAAVGGNALFAYIVPDVWTQLTALLRVPALAGPHLGHAGLEGLAIAAALTLFMLALTLLANRLGLRLKF